MISAVFLRHDWVQDKSGMADREAQHEDGSALLGSGGLQTVEIEARTTRIGA